MICLPSSRQKRVLAVTSMMILVFVLVILALVHTNTQAEESLKPAPVLDGDHQLRMVHMIFRHGERTPADTYPNDPFVNSSFSPFGWGQLTNVSIACCVSISIFF